VKLILPLPLAAAKPIAGLEFVQLNELLAGTRLLLKGKERAPFTKVNGQTL
jgi:hypothetical protein